MIEAALDLILNEVGTVVLQDRNHRRSRQRHSHEQARKGGTAIHEEDRETACPGTQQCTPFQQ
jgi:hypothetical protein